MEFQYKHINSFDNLHFNLDLIKNILQPTYDKVIVIPTYNRKDILKKTLDSFVKTKLDNNTLLIIIDDNSNEETQQFIKNYDIYNVFTIKLFKKENKCMYDSFVMGFDYAIQNYPSIKYLITLDSDTIHKPNWLEKEIQLFKRFNDNNILLTGFNTNNHKTKKYFNDYSEKHTIGGINILFHKNYYINYGREAFIHHKRDWDWGFCGISKKYKYKIICTKPSVIQHIGDIGLNSNKGKYDKANDF
jgi:glycosyltransferase involved in cell wall biosynthesis